MSPVRRGLLKAALGARLLGLAALLGAAHGAGAQPIAPAETLLFQTNHLGQLRPPAKLTYAYRKTGSIEPGFEDEVRLELAGINPDGSAKVTLHFLSGSRKRAAPDAENPQGNPVLLGFLERDIAEMKRLTGGSANYFRKRIRLALAEHAQLRRIDVSYGGKASAAQEVSIEPYRDDPLRARFEKYANKRYVFVFGEQIPGGLYQLRTSVSGAPGAPALMEETLTLVNYASGAR